MASAKARGANLQLGRAMFGFNLWPGNGHAPYALYYATTPDATRAHDVPLDGPARVEAVKCDVVTRHHRYWAAS